MQKISKLVATVFFIGYFPLASGTVASLAALIIYFFVGGNTILYFTLTAISLMLGFWSSRGAEERFGERDPHAIVIDEFSGMLLVFLFIPFSLKFLIAGFLLFRFFDILKPWPIRKLENLPAGWGILCDDLLAGVYAAVVLTICTRIWIGS